MDVKYNFVLVIESLVCVLTLSDLLRSLYKDKRKTVFSHFVGELKFKDPTDFI